MRNLKRVLSLVLASIMLIGMMVVGASAVDTYNDFSDKDEIVNKDAVSLLVTLDVINGKEDGSFFDPTGDVSRAEMAKMISVILNRGADINNQYATLNNGLTDITGHWAVGHINYCYSLDIIAGRGDGKFDPSANVTAVEAAKMLLAAAGYDASIEGMVGPNWDTNTAGLASRLGIFENFEKDITQPLNRDDAALLIYNFLDIEMIQSYENGYAIAYGDSRTVLSFAYGVIKVQGVVVANEWATVNTNDGDDAMKAGTTTIWNSNGIFSTTTNTQTGGGNTGLTNAELALRTGTFKVSTPEDYLGKSVTLYIRKTTILADSIVYGTPVLTDDNVVVTTGAQVKEGSRTTSGTLLKLLSDNNLNVDKDTLYFHNYKGYTTSDKFFTETLDSKYNVKGATLTVIDNDADGIADYVLSKEKTLSQVSAYSEKNENLNLRGINGSIAFNKVMGHEDVAKGDIVFYVQYGGRTYVEQPETVRGEMDLYNVKGDNKYIRVEGENYEQDGLTVVRNTDASKFYVDGCETWTDWDGGKTSEDITGVNFGNTYDFYLDDYGHVTGFQLVEGGSSKYALVLGSAFSTNGLRTTADVRVLLSDNTSGTYSVDWNASVKNIKSWLKKNGIVGMTAAEASTYNTNNSAAITAGTLTRAEAGDILDSNGRVVANVKNASNDWADSNAAEVLKYLLGTNDGRQGTIEKYPAAGAFAGNVIKYTLSDDNVITVDLANLAYANHASKAADGDRYVGSVDMIVIGGTPVMTGNDHSVLSADLEKGDVDLYIDANGFTSNPPEAFDNPTEFGIDDDTVIFYYNEDGSAVRIGYSDMARKIAAGTAVSVIGYKSATDVAEVIVLYPDEVKFGQETYVYVLKTFDVVSGEYRFNLVNADGSIDHDVKSKDGDLAEALRDLTDANGPANTRHGDKDGLIMSVTYDSDGYALFEEPSKFYTNPTKDVVVYGIAKFTGSSSNRYVNVYVDFTVNSKDVVDIVTSGSNKFIRLAHRSNDVVFDLTDTSWKDDNAANANLDNWQRVAIVYDNDSKVIKAAFIEEYYKNVADGDDDNNTNNTGSNNAPESVDRNGHVITTVTEVKDGTISLQAVKGKTDRQATVTLYLVDKGYENVSYIGTVGNNEMSFTARDADGKTVAFTTETYWYNDAIQGAGDPSNYESMSDLGEGAYAGTPADFNAIGGLTDTTQFIPGEKHMVFKWDTLSGNHPYILKIYTATGTPVMVGSFYTASIDSSVKATGSIVLNMQNSSRQYVQLDMDASGTSRDPNVTVWGETYGSSVTGVNEDGSYTRPTDDGYQLPVGKYTWTVETLDGGVKVAEGAFAMTALS